MEAKTKPIATEEKPKPVAKLIPAGQRKGRPPSPLQSPRAAIHCQTRRHAQQNSGTILQSTGQVGQIYEAKSDVLKNPNYIYVGMKLVIPDR